MALRKMVNHFTFKPHEVSWFSKQNEDMNVCPLNIADGKVVHPREIYNAMHLSRANYGQEIN